MSLKPITDAYRLSVEETCSQLQTDITTGLKDQEASDRLTIFGENRLEEGRKKGFFKILIEQFLSPLAWVLMVAAGLAFTFQEWLEGTAIVIVIFINAFIGLYMEWQANKSMEALRRLAQTKTNAFRNGKLKRLNTAKLVPGDIIFLEAGDVVPADCRIFEEVNLGIKEAALTGESHQVSKQTDALTGDVVLAERSNLIFKGTIVSRGNTKAIVTATGKRTELGNIAQMTEEAEKKITPLDKKLNKLSQKLILLTLVLAAIIFLIGLLQNRETYLMVKTAIALAIATIPEGLPIVATIALARGMLRLAKHQVIVKKLGAVETLGETQVIFTDKTGTLTENKLSVDYLVFEFEEGDLFFKDEGIHFKNSSKESLKGSFAFEILQKVGVLCNNASLNHEESVGDPLEVALLQFAELSGIKTNELRNDFPRIKEIPFDSDSKMMGTLNENGKRPDYLVCIKGALEVVLKESDYVLTADGRKPIVDKDVWLKRADELAKKGLRILGFAYSEIDQPEDEFFHNLTFIGFIGFIDPPREDIEEAIKTCKKAGIKVVMVTGDQLETAKTIALKTGLITDENTIAVNGSQLNDEILKNKDANQKILRSEVFARVSPAQKLDLVTIYQNDGFIVGMTGDGINDAPALKKADIGIAMGQRGTEAAKEVADLVLEEDSFSAIVMAIKQGRGIFQNIRHFVIYLLSCNLSELLVVAFAFLSNIATPLLPLQILFLNMVTDVFPALALGMNKEPENVMQQKPRAKNESIVGAKHWISIVAYALCISLSILALMYYSYYLGYDSTTSNNLIFYTLVFAQLVHVFNLTNRHQSFFNNQITKNKYIWIAILICIVITIFAYYQPTIQQVLNLEEIAFNEFWLIVPFGLLPVFLIQILKRLRIIS